MEKIVDAEILEKQIESINKCFSSNKKEPVVMNDSRVQKRTYSKENVIRLYTLDLIAGITNIKNKTEGEHPNIFDVKQFLYYASDLFMSSLTHSSKKSFMKYLNNAESENEFDELEHIRGYFLNEFDENGNERNPCNLLSIRPLKNE